MDIKFLKTFESNCLTVVTRIYPLQDNNFQIIIRKCIMLITNKNSMSNRSKNPMYS